MNRLSIGLFIAAAMMFGAALNAIVGPQGIRSAEAQVTNPCNTQICTNRSKFLSAATTNSNLVKGGQSALYNVITINTTATIYYLKLYDKATAPTCNSDTVVASYPVPYGAASSGGGFIQPRSAAAGYNLGLGFCLTGALADNDNTSAATGVAINFEYR